MLKGNSVADEDAEGGHDEEDGERDDQLAQVSPPSRGVDVAPECWPS